MTATSTSPNRWLVLGGFLSTSPSPSQARVLNPGLR